MHKPGSISVAGRAIAIALLLAPALSLAACPWPSPGANPYTGDKAAAVRRMAHIPADIREALASAVEQRTYSAHVEIRRDGIYAGTIKAEHWVGLSRMNFGHDGRVCPGLVDVSMWPADRAVGALIYHHQGYAVAVISECGNVAAVEAKQPIAAVRAVAVNAAPEPGTLALAALAIVAAVAARKARR